MNKMRLLAATAMIAMAAIAGYLGYSAYDRSTMTDAERMIHANLEALTKEIESGDGGYLNGPQKSYSCQGWFTGKGFRCAAEMDTNCEQIPCS